MRPSAEYAEFRFGIIREIEEKHVGPQYVAALLDAARDRFPEIDPREIAILAHSETWQEADPEIKFTFPRVS